MAKPPPTASKKPGFDDAIEAFCEALARRVADRVFEAISEFEAGKPDSPDLLSGPQMAKRLGISRTKLHRLRTEGCPAVKVGDVYKFEPANVLAWLKRQT